METQDLETAYLEVMMDEPGTSLAEFMERVAAGRYGAQSAERLTEFLHGVERNILGSIHTRAAANPRFAEEAPDRAEAVREEIASLLVRFARAPAGPRSLPQN